MAPISDSCYFPSLDKCLQGDDLLTSWRSAFHAVLDTEDSLAIRKFFSDSVVEDLLLHPLNAFPPPSQESRSAFGTKTSAINVTPSPTSRFNINELKEDALWLSTEAKIDEISALRVVVLEWQSRAWAALVGPLSKQELLGIQESGGQGLMSVPGALLSEGLDVDEIQAEFETKESRRSRLLRIYLSERQFLLKCVNYLLQSYLCRELSTDSTIQGQKPEAQPASFQVLGENLVRIIRESDSLFLACVDAIKSNIGKLLAGSSWFKEVGGRPDVEMEWVRTNIAEATTLMEIIFQILDISEDLPSSQAVLSWLEITSIYGFFNFHFDDPDTHSLGLHMASLAVVISLQLLKVRTVLSSVNPADIEVSEDDRQPYLLKVSTIKSMSQIINSMAENDIVAAGPVILGWAVILQGMETQVHDLKRQLSENGGGSELPANSVISSYERMMESINNISPSPDHSFPLYLAIRAVEDFRTLDTLIRLSPKFGDTANAHFSIFLGAKMRIIILDLLAVSNIVGVDYGSESTEATLAALEGGQSYWDCIDAKQLSARNDPLSIYLQEADLGSSLTEARSRYPYEQLPFLKICRALAACQSFNDSKSIKTIVDFLETIPTFTYALPDGFDDYETLYEDQNTNSIRLTRPVELFESRRRQIGGYVDQSLALIKADPDFTISAGTEGRIVSGEHGPKVAYWYHEYSGFKYLGKLLETFLPASNLIDATTGDVTDRDSIAVILSLFANLFLSLTKTSTALDHSIEALRILEIASSGLSRNRDLISVIFDIFEEELQARSVDFGSEVSLELLNSCVQLIHALLPIIPGRIWPLLGRSSLLDIGRGSGKLPSIVGSVELVSGTYGFLLSCSRLYEALVEDLVTNVISRHCVGKPSTRFAKQDGARIAVSDQVLSKVLLSFTRYLVDALESSCSWKFVDSSECIELRRRITASFERILRHTYGIDDLVPDNSGEDLVSNPVVPTLLVLNPTIVEEIGAKTKQPRLMVALEASASHLTEAFLSTASGTLRVQPLLRAFYDGLEVPDSTANVSESRLCVNQARSILEFTRTLLQVGMLLDRPPSFLEGQIFKASSVIARLYAVHQAYRTPVVALFDALITAASANATDPPSLLGHLGPHTSKNFLQIISDIDKPLSKSQNFVAITNFMSKVVSCRQQWFAKYLLGGKAFKDPLKDTSGDRQLVSLDRSPLAANLEALLKIKDIPSDEASLRLQFIASAQNFWPWSIYESEKYDSFISALLDFIGTLPPIQQSKLLDDTTNNCYQTRAVASIAEILAMHIFHSRQTGNVSPTKDIIPNLDYFIRFAVKTPRGMDYNSSLHGNLKRNFESQYAGCRLLALRRTTLEPQHYGTDYCYNLTLANKMLSFDQMWGVQKGFQKEVAAANVNLSCVDAQISLLHSWKFLATELSTTLSGQVDLQSKLARVASDCLAANLQNQGSEEIFQRLNQTRADLALILMQRLVEAGSVVHEMDAFLPKVWDAIQQSNITFEMALSSGDPAYYRSLLKLLFLGLRIHTENKSKGQMAPNESRVSTILVQSSPFIGVIVEILERVVAHGIRHLTTFIHDKPGDSNPEDIMLINGILQSCLRIPGIEFSYSQIVALFVHNKTARVATTLFSWSDTLAIEGDPIYGELSILFLLELSTVPAMAEQLAINGLLGDISTANITNYLRGGNVSPFAESAGFQRCYNIWVRGILPLVLNLVDSVGIAIAGEASRFLQQFPALLKQCIEAFDPPASSRIPTDGRMKHITLSMCSEAHTLSLLVFVLNGFRDSVEGSDIVDISWDSAAMLENVEFWLGATAILKSKILPMEPRDHSLFKKKIACSDSNKLQETILAELVGVRAVLAGISH